MTSRILTTTVSLLAITCLIMFGKSFYLEPELPGEEKMPPKVVQTVRVKKAQVPETLETIAELKARHDVVLRAAISNSTVNQILVKDGQFAKKDQILATFVPNYTLKAPFDGYLTKWLVKPGALLTQNTELVTLVDKKQLMVEYYVPEHFASKLQKGQTVKVEVRAYPGQYFNGVISFISPVVESKNHSILVRAELNNGEQALLPGTFAEVVHYFNEGVDSVVVPDSSLLQTLEGYDIYKVVNNKLEKTRVTIGSKRSGRTQVLSGLALDDQVLITLSPGLIDGAEVVAKDWQGEW